MVFKIKIIHIFTLVDQIANNVIILIPLATAMTMPVLSSSARLLARSIPIVSQRLENGPVAICVPTYRLQVRIIKREPLSLPGASRRENGEIRELEKFQTETRLHLASMLASTG